MRADEADCKPINGLFGRCDCCARARIVTAQRDSIPATANTRTVAPDSCSSSPAVGLTCRYPCVIRAAPGSQFMVALHFLFCSSCVRRHCIAGGRMGWIEAFVPGQYGPEDAGVLVGNRDQRLIVASTRMQLDDPAREPVIASVRCENGRS